MHYVGIDIAKNKHEASIIDSEGTTLKDGISFTNTQSGCEKLINILDKLSITTENVIVGMEATGHYWLSVYCHLTSLNYEVKVINPIQSEAFRKMYIRQTKNDKKDSFIIAQIMRFGQFTTTELAEEKIMALRQLSRYRVCLVEECSSCKHRIIALLDQVFPEYNSIFSDTFGVASKEVLSKYPTPEDMLNVSTKKLTTLLIKASKGRFDATKSKQLKEIAKGSFGISFAKDAFAFQIKQIIQQITFLENQLKDLDKEISVLLKQTDSFITTIPGIGDTLGAVILGEIGDISRFSSPAKLVAYAGLDASVKQSGEFTGTHNHLSKRGSPYLRRAIWLAATRAAFCDPILSAHYQSAKSRGKHHLVAISSVARKLCNIIFAILSENRPYEPTPPTKSKD
jgi:transposase